MKRKGEKRQEGERMKGKDEGRRQEAEMGRGKRGR